MESIGGFFSWLTFSLVFFLNEIVVLTFEESAFGLPVLLAGKWESYWCFFFSFFLQRGPKCHASRDKHFPQKKTMLRKSLSKACLSHKIHVWYIYLHLLYGIFTYIYHKNQLNVGKYTIHGIPMSLRTTRPLPHQFPDFPRFDSSLKAHFTKHRRFRCGAHEIKRP